MYCPDLFLSQSGMFRHQNKCKNDEIFQLKQEEADIKIKCLEQEKKHKDQIIDSTIKNKKRNHRNLENSINNN